MSETEFDADTFAQIAAGDDPAPSDGAGEGNTTENHAAAEGAPETTDSDVGSESTLRDMLMNTDPETPLSQVESPWNPDEGGVARVYRGLMKAADIDGLPAVADILIGLLEFAHVVGDGLGPNGEGDDGDEQADAPEQQHGELSGV